VALAAAVRWLVPPPPPAAPEPAYPVPTFERRVTVEVLNATKRAGVARAATRKLRQRGLDVVFFGNAEATVDSTRIILRRADQARGRRVREALGVGVIVLEPDTLRRVDVTVLVGMDY
jgi:LytR cell envelope-related transcriptional attenuator